MRNKEGLAVSSRSAVPRAVRDQVLAEYNHLCAVCGGTKPHLHHIDGDNTNHEALNLLPLCPNHHLGDQHDPTRSMEPRRLMLFRQYKDPAILSPQFEPLYARLRFLDDLSVASTDLDMLTSQAEELMEFVGALRMGDFYSVQIGRLIEPISHPFVITDKTTDAELARWSREHHEEYVDKLHEGRDGVLRLCVELLRYQDWLPGDDL